MKDNKKIIATIEARMTSSRLPGKILMDLAGKPSLQHMIERLKRSKYIDDVVVATTVNKTDDPVVSLCEDLGCKYYRGSEDDVLLRVLEAARAFEADVIVETTGDCPVIDWRYADQAIDLFFSDDYDYVSNCLDRTFPIGFDVQVFSTNTLNEVNQLTTSAIDHEHVSIYIYSHPEKYKLQTLKAEGKLYWPELEITLDTKEDYIFIQKIYNELYNDNPDFTAEEVVDLLRRKPELLKIVQDVKRTVI